MGFFNDALVEALFTGNYVCRECGAPMEFEDEWKDILVCPSCGYSVELDRYGFDSDEEYDALYPTKEEVCGYEDEYDDEDDGYNGETYDEVYGELDD